jgi:hypothetical protein
LYPFGSGDVFYATILLYFCAGSPNRAITSTKIPSLFGATKDARHLARKTATPHSFELQTGGANICGPEVSVTAIKLVK